jgi:uncharacterized protein YegL
MKNKKTLYNFIIDRSGSMAGMEEMAVCGFNENLRTIKDLKKEFPNQEFLCSLTIFDNEIESVINFKSIEEINPITVGQYSPRGMTALLDAIGKTIHDVNSEFQKQIETNEITVVFIVITDGYENASRFFSYNDIAKKIKSLEETEKWTFTFLGADFDAIETSRMLNIKSENVMNFDKSNYSGAIDEINEQMKMYSDFKEKGHVKHNFFSKIR